MLRSTRFFVLVPATLAAFTAACFNPGHQKLTITDDNGHVVRVTIDGEDVAPVASESPAPAAPVDERAQTVPATSPVVEPVAPAPVVATLANAAPPAPAYPDPSWAPAPAYPNPEWAPAPVDNVGAGDARAAAPAPAPRPAPSSELIVNGDFENPALSYGSWSQFPSIQGWKLSFGHSIEVQNHAAGSPVQGDQFVELDSNGSSGIYQEVATVPGARYELNFRYSPRPGVEESNNAIEVWIDGDRLATVSSNGADLRDTSWARIVLPVHASGRQLRVEFRDAGTSDSYGGYIDAVSLKAR